MKTKQLWRILVCACVMIGLTGCWDWEDGRSSVPSYPVKITLDTRVGAFVHFIPSNINSYVVVKKDGILYNNIIYPRPIDMYYGYAGVVINVNNQMQYTAFDLCCPKCLNRLIPIEVFGGFADCPSCGESYELMNGLGTPSKGISRESLRRYSVSWYDGVVQVSN